MLVDEKVDRFATNWGVDPNSITLQQNWTTPIDSQNIEMAGKDFSRERDFGNGLAGLGSLGLGFIDTGIVTPPTPATGFNLSNFIPDVSNWDWHEWLLALGSGYTVYQIFFGPRATQRKSELKSAEESYRSRRKRIKEDYSFSPFASPKKRSYEKP